MSIETNWFQDLQKKYGVKQLIWYEVHNDVSEAIKREKNIRHGSENGSSA